MRARSAATLGLVCLALALGGETCPPGPPPDPSPGEFVVAAFGDSLTAGWLSFPGYSAALDEATVWTILHEGIAGECGSPHKMVFVCPTYAGGAQRLRDAIEPLLEEPGIDAVVAMWGTNDAGVGAFYLTNGGEQGPSLWATQRDDYIHDITEAVALARTRRVDVVYVFPPKTFGADAEVRNPLLLELRAALAGPLQQMGAVMVDLYAASEADPGMIDEADGIHFTPDGAEAAAALIQSALAPF
ncbi:MAG TPA: SGNH/GDSL hydrolase family protein, partial [Vicinamibacteria bacterium]|nr:SGNH/GDSL hydrolase family protein [Vicinamibacteria bacterium]